jgi:hypothetical protein
MGHHRHQKTLSKTKVAAIKLFSFKQAHTNSQTMKRPKRKKSLERGSRDVGEFLFFTGKQQVDK